MPTFSSPASVRSEGRIDERRVLHVQADEVPQPGGVLDDPLDVFIGELLVDVEAEVRQLDGEVRLQRLGVEAVEDRQVLVGDRPRLGLVEDVLAEHGRVGVQAALVQRAEDDHAGVEILPGDEA